MSEHVAKENCYNIEEKEYKLNLHCENKFKYMAFLSQTDRISYFKSSHRKVCMKT